MLAGLDTQAGGTLTYEVREVEQDGKKARVACVKAGEAEAIPLTTYAEQQWSDFLPALQVQPPQRPGTPYPAQQSGNKPPASDLVAQSQVEDNGTA